MIKKIISYIKKILTIILKLISDEQKKEIPVYKRKNFMTEYELDFYNKIKELEEEYKIVPQINLATIVKKVNKGYINELFKNIDFAIFSKDYKEVLLLIEINDKSHNKKSRKKRDLKVQKICNDSNLKLITFYTKYPNKKEYVVKRILETIKKNNNTNINIDTQNETRTTSYN